MSDTQRFRNTCATKRITASGRVLDYLRPRPQDIHIHDIAEALSKQCRFSGHTNVFYSVAQHSCLVHDLCPIDERPWALLHDAHEAYMGDLPTPLQAALHALGGGGPVVTIRRNLDNAIATAFGLQFPASEKTRSEVRYWDLTALSTEREVLFPTKASRNSIWPKDLPRPRPAALKRAWTWSQALDQFMQRFNALNLPCGAGSLS